MASEMEEYYQQGDLERKLDYSITPFYDRTTCNPFKYQLGYIDVVVLPLFNTWIEFKEVFREDCLTKGLEENRRLLETKVEETKSLMAMGGNGGVGAVQPQPAQDAKPISGKDKDSGNATKDKKGKDGADKDKDGADGEKKA